MDITVSSNFERLMFDLYNRDGDSVYRLMEQFKGGQIDLSEQAMVSARQLFASQCVSDEATCAEIARVWKCNGYLLDPHSAIGTRAAIDCSLDAASPMVTLATAHPAKFPDAIVASGIHQTPPLPAHLADLFDRPEKMTVLANDLSLVQQHMAANVRA
jgi:threonine synthase